MLELGAQAADMPTWLVAAVNLGNGFAAFERGDATNLFAYGVADFPAEAR